MSVRNLDADVIIIGAGMSGLCTASELLKQDISCLIIEQKKVYPDYFRAERIDFNSEKLFDEFGISAVRTPKGPSFAKGIAFERRFYGLRGTRVEYELPGGYGIRYNETVNNFREQVTASGCIRYGRVDTVNISDDYQQVVLRDGTRLICRLVVIGTGPGSKLPQKLGMNRVFDERLKSVTFGFDVRRLSNAPLEFGDINFFANPRKHHVIAITVFHIGDAMRVNMFTQWRSHEPRVRKMREDPVKEVNRFFPKLRNFIGDFEATTKVQCWPAEYWRLENVEQPGVVVLADAYQSIDPTRGCGLMKSVTDVGVLTSRCVSEWLKTPGMGTEKIRMFYSDPEKQSMDENGHAIWVWLHRQAHFSLQKKAMERVTLKLKALFSKSN